MPETNSNQPKAAKPSRRRARKTDGTYKGDNPATPNVNEAWVPTEMAEVVSEKVVDYSVKPKVSTISDNTAGKYAKREKIRPTFGNVTSISH